MIADPVAQALHQKRSLGGSLSAEETEHLQRWYAQMDAEEDAILSQGRQSQPIDSEALQAAIEATNAKIVAEAVTIEALEKENERLRRAIASLERQVAQKLAPQSV